MLHCASEIQAKRMAYLLSKNAIESKRNGQILQNRQKKFQSSERPMWPIRMSSKILVKTMNINLSQTGQLLATFVSTKGKIILFMWSKGKASESKVAKWVSVSRKEILAPRVGQAWKKCHITDVSGAWGKNCLRKSAHISKSELKNISGELDSRRKEVFRNLFYLYIPLRAYLVHLKGPFKTYKITSGCDFKNAL